MEINGTSARTLAESREGVGEADRKEDKDAGHVVRAQVKKIQQLTLQQPTYPERHILISSPHKATRNMKHWKTQKLNTTQIFQYTQNKVAQPDCINHLLKKYLLLYCMNKLEEAPASTHSLFTTVRVGKCRLIYGLEFLSYFSHDRFTSPVMIWVRITISLVNTIFSIPGRVIKTLLGSYPTT